MQSEYVVPPARNGAVRVAQTTSTLSDFLNSLEQDSVDILEARKHVPLLR